MSVWGFNVQNSYAVVWDVDSLCGCRVVILVPCESKGS